MKPSAQRAQPEYLRSREIERYRGRSWELVGGHGSSWGIFGPARVRVEDGDDDGHVGAADGGSHVPAERAREARHAEDAEGARRERWLREEGIFREMCSDLGRDGGRSGGGDLTLAMKRPMQPTMPAAMPMLSWSRIGNCVHACSARRARSVRKRWWCEAVCVWGALWI